METQSYIGKCCGIYSVKAFLRTSKSVWLKRMQREFKNMTGGAPEAGQIAAWDNCFDVLRVCLGQADVMKLSLVFEYALPLYKPGTNKGALGKPVRPDVILLEKSTVIMLEFKRMRDFYKGHLGQSQKYKRRIQKYHIGSVGMTKRTIYVLTKATGVYREHYRGSYCCSPDNLNDTLAKCLPENPLPYHNVQAWVESGFVADPRANRFHLFYGWKRFQQALQMAPISM